MAWQRTPRPSMDAQLIDGKDRMASNRVWNLMYVLGNTGRVTGDAANPQEKVGALSGAEHVSTNGWRVWVEHHKTGKRLFESDAEKEHMAASAV